MSILHLRDLGAYGIIADVDPFNIPTNAFSDGLNVRFDDGCVERGAVFRNVDTLDGDAPRFCTFFVGPSDAEELIVGYKNGSLARWIVGGTETDVSIGSYTPSDSDGRFTSCKLGGVLYINRNDRVPWDWKPGDSAFEALGGGWDSGWRCNILRAYADCLVAFNITKSGTEYPTMIKTSDIATYGAVPTTWDETDLTANATENVLAEMQGDILDAQTLGNNMIVYTRYETWMMQADGSDAIFNYRRLFNDAGIINANCAVEIEGKHYVFGYKDIWVHDGVGKESICNSRIRKKVFTNLDFGYDYRCFVHANILLNEIYFCYNDGAATSATFGGVEGCNRAAVYNYKNNTWSFYALPNVFFASDMVLSNPVTYATTTSTYDALSVSYFNVSETGKRAPVMVGDVSTDHGLVEAIYGVDLDGEQSVLGFDIDTDATTTWFLEKRGIDLDELNLDLRGYKNIVAVYPQVRLADDEQSVDFSFSASDTFGVTNAYSDAQSYDNMTYYKLDFHDGGRYLAYKIDGGGDGDKGFKMSGIDFDVEITGER